MTTSEKSWYATKDFINEYSKIQDAKYLTGYTNEIKHDEKLLLIKFMMLTEKITHSLTIIRTVKDGVIICGHPSYPFLNLESMLDTRGRRIQSETTSDDITNYPLRLLYDYHNPNTYSRCARYVVRLHEDNVLDDVKTKKQQQVPSLLQLCISAIPTKNLEQYNHMNRTMQLALK